MTRPVKVVVWIAVVAALSAVVVLTRPGPGGFDAAPVPREPVPPTEPVVPQDTGIEAIAAVEPDAEAGDAGSSDADAAADSAPVNPARSDGHGPNDVVRTRDVEVKAAAAPRPRFEPKWDAPTTLTFASLRKYRREFRQNGDFSDGTVRALSGAAVVIKGAVMPIDPIPASGEMKRLWIANPLVVMAGCVFCAPPTLADIVFVQTPAGKPYEADRERLYRSVVIAEARGRMVLGPLKGRDGVEYMFGLELKEISD
jgi:hypothetical protein